MSPTSIDPTNIQPNPSKNDPATATLNAWETEVFNTRDRDVTGSFNVRTVLSSGGSRATFVKAGFKMRDKQKVRDFEATSGSPSSAVLFPELQDTGFDNSRFLDFFPAGYAPFPGIAPDKSRAMFDALPASRLEVDREGDAVARAFGEGDVERAEMRTKIRGNSGPFITRRTRGGFRVYDHKRQRAVI